MQDFLYEAAGADGKVVKGKMRAQSERDVQRNLKGQGLNPLLIKKGGEVSKKSSLFESSLTLNDQILVLEEMAVLLKAGVNLADAVASVAESGVHVQVSRAFTEIDKMLKRGEKFSGALKKHFAALPPYVYNLIEASEMTGKLDEGLKDSVAQLQYDQRVKEEIQSAIMYPSILLTVGTGAVVFIFVVVVPKFEMLFQGANKENLPVLSDIVLSTGIWVRDHIGLLAMIMAALATTFFILWRQEKFKYGFLEFIQKMPLVGTWLRETEIGRWSSMLALMLRNRIPLMQSLEPAKSTLTLPNVRHQMTQVSNAVRGGSNLANALAAHTNFPPVTINLVRVGEKAGNLDEMLGSLATLFERSGKQRMKKFLSILEPASIVFIGGFIGLIVTGIILGLTSLGDMNF